MSEQDLLFELKCLQRSSARKRFRKDIFDAWTCCAYCGSDRATTLDHVIPRAKGGPTCRSNLVASCPTCNLHKSDSDFFSWFRSQEFWLLEREEKLLEWVNQDHMQVESAREYNELCQTPLLCPSTTASPDE